jgi:hypothetical protein
MGKGKGMNGVAANGHGHENGILEKVDSIIYEEENIFLFLPNLIGTYSASQLVTTG